MNCSPFHNLLDDFWCHPVGGADVSCASEVLAESCLATGDHAALHLDCSAKVSQQDVAAVQQDVACLREICFPHN